MKIIHYSAPRHYYDKIETNVSIIKTATFFMKIFAKKQYLLTECYSDTQAYTKTAYIAHKIPTI